MFRHPSYYKNLRKLARNSELHVRPISGSEAREGKPDIICSAASKTDQAISKQQATASSTRSPGSSSKRQATSYKLPGPRPISNANKGLIHRRQASSVKHQASEDS